ncbi:Syntaxin-61 [Hibiscus syriacus]|uniref:Syntaxin-61 n=1 Tax=Hibiscus syriacus TaxID=106335 RepID=A0A6A3BL09_HIBSY|nr:Syntaxin-61 [Hibiscus syriacus]
MTRVARETCGRGRGHGQKRGRQRPNFHRTSVTSITPPCARVPMLSSIAYALSRFPPYTCRAMNGSLLVLSALWAFPLPPTLGIPKMRYHFGAHFLNLNRIFRRRFRPLRIRVETPIFLTGINIGSVAGIDKLQSSFHQWERIRSDEERGHLTKELFANCESIEWQVDELDKAISVAARDPSWYGIEEVELENRRRWTSNARTQCRIFPVIIGGKCEESCSSWKGNGNSASAVHRELMRLPNSHRPDRSNLYSAEDNDDFIASESDRQMLLIKQQDKELDDLSASVERIGGVGLTNMRNFLHRRR